MMWTKGFICYIWVPIFQHTRLTDAISACICNMSCSSVMKELKNVDINVTVTRSNCKN